MEIVGKYQLLAHLVEYAQKSQKEVGKQAWLRVGVIKTQKNCAKLGVPTCMSLPLRNINTNLKKAVEILRDNTTVKIIQ